MSDVTLVEGGDTIPASLAASGDRHRMIHRTSYARFGHATSINEARQRVTDLSIVATAPRAEPCGKRCGTRPGTARPASLSTWPMHHGADLRIATRVLELDAARGAVTVGATIEAELVAMVS